MDKKRIKENHIFRIVMIVLCIVIALVSNIVLAKNYSSPEYTVNKKTITYLDEKKTTALELCAGATALSAAITLIPGDTGTPIAEKLTDLSGYFLIVVSAISREIFTDDSGSTHLPVADTGCDDCNCSVFWNPERFLLETRGKDADLRIGSLCSHSCECARVSINL